MKALPQYCDSNQSTAVHARQKKKNKYIQSFPRETPEKYKGVASFLTIKVELHNLSFVP